MNKINSTVVLIVIILILGGVLGYYVHKNMEYEQELASRKQNEAALKGELIKTKNRNGELVTSKAILETEVDGLKTYSEDLAMELKKTKEDVTYLNKLILEFRNKPQISNGDKVINYGDNIYGIEWEFIQKFEEDYRRTISGLTKFKYDPDNYAIIPMNTTLIRDYFNFPLISGFSERNGIINGFGSTPIPGLSITDINGWRKPPNPVKPKRFGLGLYTGYGLTYSPSNTMIYHGFQIGGGVYYKIW